MASQVFSGNGNFSYTNTNSQNVRVIINFMQAKNISANAGGITITWAGVTVSAANAHSMGRNLAGVNAIRIERQNFSSTGNLAYSYISFNSQNTFGYGYAALGGNNLISVEGAAPQQQNMALPTEVMLAPNQSFSAVCGPYNIVIIKEDGS